MNHTERTKAHRAARAASPDHWSNVVAVHTITASFYRDGHARVSYNHLDMATKRLVSDYLADYEDRPECVAPALHALADGLQALSERHAEQLELF